MYEVSELVMGDIPYEEYVPSAKELHLIEDSAPLVYATYWKVLCHFHICAEITGWMSGGVKQMTWVNYLFNGLGDKVDRLTRLVPSTNAEIEERISTSTPFIPQNQLKILLDRAQSLKVFIIRPRLPFPIGPC